MLAICGGYQLLGNYFLTHTGEKLPGIGALDVHTIGGTKRLIGNLAVQTDLPIAPQTLIGFENHSGRTYVGCGAQPLGRVLAGAGNNGEDGSEGAHVYNTFGCYLHGSLLPKNPHFADYLISQALERRYGSVNLPLLDDTIERHAQHSTCYPPVDLLMTKLRSAAQSVPNYAHQDQLNWTRRCVHRRGEPRLAHNRGHNRGLLLPDST